MRTGSIDKLLAQVTLADYDALAPGQFTKRLDSFFADLQNWCKATGHYLNMVRLTKDQLGIDTGADFPVATPCCIMSLFSGFLC